MKALELAFPFLKPFDNLIRCCFSYVLPLENSIQPGQLEHVITEWQDETGEQLVGSFSMSIGTMFAMAGAKLGGEGEEGEEAEPDLSQTVQFEPYKGEPDKLCKLQFSVGQEGQEIFPLITIELIASEELRKQQIMAFASEIEAYELIVVLSNDEERGVAPAELL